MFIEYSVFISFVKSLGGIVCNMYEFCVYMCNKSSFFVYVSCHLPESLLGASRNTNGVHTASAELSWQPVPTLVYAQIFAKVKVMLLL